MFDSGVLQASNKEKWFKSTTQSQTVGNSLPPPPAKLHQISPWENNAAFHHPAIQAIEASNQMEQSNLAAWLQFECALNPYQQFFV
jgi:hypothetical protein